MIPKLSQQELKCLTEQESTVPKVGKAWDEDFSKNDDEEEEKGSGVKQQEDEDIMEKI